MGVESIVDPRRRNAGIGVDVMAVTLTNQELAAHLGIITSDTQPIPGPYVTRVVDDLQAAAELVERRAPLAPTNSQNRAVVLICGYWFEAPSASPQRYGYSAWLHSEAAAILAPFISRRAQAI